jgi:hypothetical protein
VQGQAVGDAVRGEAGGEEQVCLSVRRHGFGSCAERTSELIMLTVTYRLLQEGLVRVESLVFPFQFGRKIDLPTIIDSVRRLTDPSRLIIATSEHKRLGTCLDHHTYRKKEKKAPEKQG